MAPQDGCPADIPFELGWLVVPAALMGAGLVWWRSAARSASARLDERG